MTVWNYMNAARERVSNPHKQLRKKRFREGSERPRRAIKSTMCELTCGSANMRPQHKHTHPLTKGHTNMNQNIKLDPARLAKFIALELHDRHRKGEFSLLPQSKNAQASGNVEPAPQSLLVAQADRPSARQRQEACMEMLGEARATIDALADSIGQMLPKDLESALSNEADFNMLQNEFLTAEAKLAAVRDQCGDVLPASSMRDLRELEDKLKKLRHRLGEARSGGVDFRELADSIGNALGQAASAVATAVTILFRIFVGPGHQRTEGPPEETVVAHRGSGRVDLA
jgi:hypothetical protein